MTLGTVSCPTCDEPVETVHPQAWRNVTGISTSDGKGWTRIELDDETIRRVGRGTHTLVAVPRDRVDFIKAVIATMGENP